MIVDAVDRRGVTPFDTEMFGVTVPQKKIDTAVRDIETRFIQAARLIGVAPQTTKRP